MLFLVIFKMLFLNPVLNTSTERILCFYINVTSRIQVIRVTNIPDFDWERIVFPGQRLLFEAVTAALLEVHTSDRNTAILADVIPCQQLCLIDS